MRDQSVAPELFDAPTSYREQTGLSSLSRRIEVLDLVPHAAGELWVPAIEIAYWDPDAQRYASATSEPFAIEVQPEPERVARPGAGNEQSAATAGPADAARQRFPLTTRPGLLGAAIAGLAGFGLFFFLGWRRRAGGERSGDR
jgi:hypothetical protein